MNNNKIIDLSSTFDCSTKDGLLFHSKVAKGV